METYSMDNSSYSNFEKKFETSFKQILCGKWIYDDEPYKFNDDNFPNSIKKPEKFFNQQNDIICDSNGNVNAINNNQSVKIPEDFGLNPIKDFKKPFLPKSKVTNNINNIVNKDMNIPIFKVINNENISSLNPTKKVILLRVKNAIDLSKKPKRYQRRRRNVLTLSKADKNVRLGKLFKFFDEKC